MCMSMDNNIFTPKFFDESPILPSIDRQKKIQSNFSMFFLLTIIMYIHTHGNESAMYYVQVRVLRLNDVVK